jgi:hypothetical protein
MHDHLVPSDHNDLIELIDKEIHYNLLKLYETPFYQFSYIIAKYYRLKRKVGISGMDLFNVMEDLKSGDFKILNSAYNNIVRNGIAHGKVVYTDIYNIYKDKKGNSGEFMPRDIVALFDLVLDLTNGLSLAFKTFCFSNSAFLAKNDIIIPQSILIEELQSRMDAPGWQITSCLESRAMNDKRQLIIYIKNSNWDFNKVQFFCFSTAYWAERLTKRYERIFLSIRSAHAMPGWAAFDAGKLRYLREHKIEAIEEYGDVLEERQIFFVPKFKFPRIIYKLGTVWSIIRILAPIQYVEFANKHLPNPFLIRNIKAHSRRTALVVEDSVVVIKPGFQDQAKELVNRDYRKIVRQAIRYSRKKFSRLSYKRYLPVVRLRVFIYDSDKRIRQLQNSGLHPELVCTIELNRSRKIRTIDINNSTVEVRSNYRIAWFNNWRGNTASGH